MSKGKDAKLSLHEKIDICRGVFAALVVMAHSVEMSWGVHREAASGLGEPLRSIVAGLLGTGTYYVLGFFVLSGYCIHQSVERSSASGRLDLGRYAVARLTRILPLYYLGLAAALAAEWMISGARPMQWPHGLDAGTFVAQLFMVQNLTETFGCYASSWSLTNEVFYYAFYGLLFWMMAGPAPSRSRTGLPAWAGLGLCTLILITAQALYVTVGRNPAVYSVGQLFGLGTIWFAGALIAVHGRDWVRHPWVRAAARCWPAALAATIAWKAMLLPPHGLYLMSGASFSLLLLHLIATSPEKNAAEPSPWRRRVITTLGLASYPMYLFHGPLLMLVASGLMRSGAIHDWRITAALLIAVGWLAGAPLGWLLERPTMEWRAALIRRLGRSPERVVPASGRGPSVPIPAAIGAGSRA